jgi:hypothetical protein
MTTSVNGSSPSSSSPEKIIRFSQRRMISRAVVCRSPGTFERRLVLTDDPQAKLRSHFSALDPPGLPASTSRWAYLDAVDGLPALQSLAALGGTRLSPGFVRKLTPLRSVLAYVTHAGSTETLTVDVRQLP